MVHVGVERARRGCLGVALSADSGINGQISEPEQVRARIVRTSPVVPNEGHRFAASSESVLRIMRNPRLLEMRRTTAGGSGQRPCCLAGIGDIGGANGR
jgi:hypothetical protein